MCTCWDSNVRAESTEQKEDQTSFIAYRRTQLYDINYQEDTDMDHCYDNALAIYEYMRLTSWLS